MLTPVVLLLALDAAPSVEIRPGDGPLRVVVRATLTGKLLVGVPTGALTQEQGERRLRFCLIDPDNGEEGPAVLGNYRREQTTLVFVPRHLLTHGQRYRAVLDLGGGKKATADYRVPAAAATPPPVVEHIYPTTGVLPANQLKFYLHFSRPMRESKEVFDQILLLDARGKPVLDPWRRTELWSPDGRRLTLWIHPGRIKQGIGLREAEGPVLEPDRRYTLVLGADLTDASGQRLGKEVRKPFRTTADDRSRPLPEKWKLRAPEVKTRHPLVVEFPEPLDRALLDRFLTIKDSAGKAIKGRIEVGKEERSWLFHPEQPWEDAGYSLAVDGQLEDLAGNTPLRLFDVDLDEPPPAPPTLALPFKPRR
jgi:hypothetical protein